MKKNVAAPEPKRVNTLAAKEPAKQPQKESKSDNSSSGGGALSGLLGYGSDSS